MWAAIAFIASIVISFVRYLITPVKKQKNAEPGTIEKSDVNMAKEGDYIKKVWHKRWIKNATVLYFGNVNTIPIRKNAGGKKG